ncbi:MAG: zinc-ribbon domain-containing protein [Nanoarchaeota archaeon]
MFGRKTCSKCNEKVSDKYSFCPHCGNLFGKKNEEKDYGMLGIDDEMEMQQNPFEALLGGMGSGVFNKMFGGAIKMLEKELEKEFKNQNQKLPQRTNFEIIINGKRINPENIKFTQRIIEPENKPKKKFIPKMSSESLKKISKLPKKEPSTNIRRLANKIIYELDIPGVKSMEDISITKLENSIEVKAVAGNKAYSKLIPINLPITNYELLDGKLTLELDAKS